jgi:hypothetical protein
MKEKKIFVITCSKCPLHFHDYDNDDDVVLQHLCILDSTEFPCEMEHDIETGVDPNCPLNKNDILISKALGE